MPKRTDQEPKPTQISFLSIVDPPPHLVEPDEPLPQMEIFDPEALLARLHNAMQRTRHAEPIVDDDIRREVIARWQALLKLWNVPSDAEIGARMRETFAEAVEFLRLVPFRGTTVMDYFVNHELTSQDILDLRSLLAGQHQIFPDESASDGFRWYGDEAAFYRDQAANPRAPRRLLRKR